MLNVIIYNKIIYCRVLLDVQDLVLMESFLLLEVQTCQSNSLKYCCLLFFLSSFSFVFYLFIYFGAYELQSSCEGFKSQTNVAVRHKRRPSEASYTNILWSYASKFYCNLDDIHCHWIVITSFHMIFFLHFPKLSLFILWVWIREVELVSVFTILVDCH